MPEAVKEERKRMEMAVMAAAEYFADAMKTTDTKINGVRLEEIEKSDDGKKWIITISYMDITSGKGVFSELYDDESKRINKVFIVDGSSYDVISMKNKK